MIPQLAMPTVRSHGAEGRRCLGRMGRAFSPFGGDVRNPGALPQAGIGRAAGPGMDGNTGRECLRTLAQGFPPTVQESMQRS